MSLISRCCKAPFCFRHPTENLQDSIVPHKHGNSSNYNKMCPFGVWRLHRYVSIQNNSYELYDVCRVLIFRPHKSFRGGIEGFKDKPHSDPSFGIKWHNMAKSQWMTGSWKALSDLWKSKWSQSFPTLWTDPLLKHLAYFAALVVLEVKTIWLC